MTEPKFKVGDLAWSPSYGFDVIKKSSNFVFKLLHGEWVFTERGLISLKCKHPTLLTVEEAAKLGYYPPKRKVTKTIERWVNVYADGSAGCGLASKELCDSFSGNGLDVGKRTIACVKLTGSYEIEE